MVNWKSTIANGSSINNSSFVVGQLPITLAYSFLFAVSAFGNSFIVWTIYKDHRLRTTTNFLVANIAVSDIVCTIFWVPKNIVEVISDHRWLIGGDFGLALCKLLHQLLFFPAMREMLSDCCLPF